MQIHLSTEAWHMLHFWSISFSSQWKAHPNSIISNIKAHTFASHCVFALYCFLIFRCQMMYSLKWANNALKDSLNYFRAHFRCLPLHRAKRGETCLNQPRCEDLMCLFSLKPSMWHLNKSWRVSLWGFIFSSHTTTSHCLSVFLKPF